MRENKIKVTTVCALFALQFFLAAIAGAIEDKNSLQTCLDMQGKVPSDKVLECYNQVAQEQVAKSESKKKYRSLIAERGIGLAEEWTPSDEPLQIYKQNYFLFYSHSSQPNNTPTSPNPKDQVPCGLVTHNYHFGNFMITLIPPRSGRATMHPNSYTHTVREICCQA